VDLRNTPHDTCPLCRQQALTLSDNLLRCSSCQSVAELDPASHRIKYITVAPEYQEFESALKQDWLSRRQVFDLTTRPLPVVVFLPIILSLLALCILLGTVGAVLAIRPSLMNTRALIEAAYAPTADLTANPVVSVTEEALQSPLSTGEVTDTLTAEASPNPNPTVEGDGALPTATIQTQTSIETKTPEGLPGLFTETPSGNAPPSQPPTATFTPLPATNTPIPTSGTRIVGLTPGQTSPLATPTFSANGSTLTPTPNSAQLTQTPATATATPTATQVGAATATSTVTPNPLTPSPTPTETVIFSGTFPSGTAGRSILQSNFIVIADVKVKGDPSFNEGDEYIDLRNNSDLQSVTMIHWKIRINNGASYFIPNESASASFSIPPQQGCRIYTGSVSSQNTPPPYNWCGPQSLGSPTSTTGVYTNDHGTIEILDESGKTVASFTY